MRARTAALIAAAGILLTVAATPAWAYVGPGAGLSLLGALWALIAAIGSAILYVVLWPLRRWRKRRKGGGKASGSDSGPPADNGN